MLTRPSVYPRWALTGPRTVPTDDKRAAGFAGAEKPGAQYVNELLWESDQWVEYLDAAIAIALFGDGRDGTVTLDGTVTVPWASKSGSTYTLIANPQLVDLTIANSGVTVLFNGHVIKGLGVLDNTAGGKFSADGSSNTFSGGSGALFSTYTMSAARGPQPPTGSGSPVGGNAGKSVTNAYGGNGGAGGGGSGGAGGTATPPAAAFDTALAGDPGVVRGSDLAGALQSALIAGGASGGTGAAGSLAGDTGGAPGDGAGVGIVYFAQIKWGSTPVGNLSAKGGNGGNGAGAVGTTGGGGGGGGYLRVVAIACDVVFTAAACCPGGAGGTVSGVSGSVGAVRQTVFAPSSTLALGTQHVEEGVITLTGSETTATATFNAPFANTPGSAGGYKYQISCARSDNVAAPPVAWPSDMQTDHIGFTINDPFQGTISWKAWTK